MPTVDTTAPLRPRLADLIFVLLSLCFVLLACKGSLLLTPAGCGLDSDMQNYAQILEVQLHPELFAADPVAPYFHLDPGAPNIMTFLALLVHKETPVALDLILAGALVLLTHLLTWYCAGRVLFRSPSLSAILSLLMAVTVYWSFGTFWGAFYSDPVPRTGFSALFPFLLLLACLSLQRSAARPVLMIATGLCLWMHSVSALTAAGMFLTALLLIPAQDCSWKTAKVRHLGMTALSTACFLLLFALFYHQRIRVPALPPDEHVFFQTIRALRFSDDWSTPWTSLFAALKSYCVIPLIPAGLAAGLVLVFQPDRLSPPSRLLFHLLPFCLLGLVATLCLCWLEMHLSEVLHRPDLSRELLRGSRFLVPLCWLAICGLLSLVWHRIPGLLRLAIPVCVLFVIFCVSAEKQVLAVRMAAADMGFSPAASSQAEAIRTKNLKLAMALDAVRERVPADELIFTPDDVLALRYAAGHAMAPAHKDGNIIYYARISTLARSWYAEQKALLAAPDSLPRVWQSNGAPWLFTSRENLRESLLTLGEPVFENEDWLLLRRR